MAQKSLLEKYLECLQNSNRENIQLTSTTTKSKKEAKRKPLEVKKEYKRKYFGKKELAITKTRERMGKMRPVFVELLTELERAILCHRPENIKSFSAEYLECKLSRRALFDGVYDEDYDASVCYEEEEESQEERKELVKPCVRCSFETDLRTHFRKEMEEITGRTTESRDAARCVSADQATTQEESKVDVPPIDKFNLGYEQPCLSDADESSPVMETSKIDPPPTDPLCVGYEGDDEILKVMESSQVDPPPTDPLCMGYEEDVSSPVMESSNADPPPTDPMHVGYGEGEKKESAKSNKILTTLRRISMSASKHSKGRSSKTAHVVPVYSS